MTLRLLGNLDAVEPAGTSRLRSAGAGENVRGLALNDARFLVTRVSVEHSNDAGKPPEDDHLDAGRRDGGRCRDHAGRAGDGDQAAETADASTPGKRVKQVLLSPGTGTIAALNDDGYVYITRNFSAVTPTWTRYADQLA